MMHNSTNQLIEELARRANGVSPEKPQHWCHDCTHYVAWNDKVQLLTKEKKVKIKITMKNPDAMYDAVQDAVKEEVTAMGLPEDEAESLIELRTDKENAKMDKWFEYGEYLEVEFDTDAMTATVLERA